MFQLGLQCSTPGFTFSDSVQQALRQGVPKEIETVARRQVCGGRKGCIKLLQPNSGSWGTQIMQELGIALLSAKLAHPHPHFPGDYLKLREIKDQPRITQQSHNRARI